jgi:hypothetical protein
MEQELQALRDQIIQMQGQLQTQQNALQAIPQVPQAIQVQGPANQVKPDRPSPFSGKKSESLEGWIFQMQQYCDLLPVPLQNRIAFAGTFFKDQAALWWRSYHQKTDWVNAAPTWEQFLEATRRHFTPVNTTISAYDRLQRLTQKTSVNAYNHEFRTIMLELPDMDAATRMNYYTRGLKENIRPFVSMQTPNTLEEAEVIAERVDATTFKPIPRSTGFRPNRGYQAPGGPTPMDLDAITKLDPVERERLRKIGGCFRCRKPGHLARDCPLTNRQHPRIHAIDTQESGQLEESGKD